ncbi:type III pantothenate kinase [Antarcticibacterium flavum]|uniref:Type III pantothenate kinase n=1 Tax=Antarcticibacterium flavum TaxID=2058175 RepID=A0A5B7X3N9_9FLAO|nr:MULTISPECIES: type III pantothenate kinase [Antarcticibacterium]MCM4160985.1 type III pantothenate kinase [Antarcticibacterium sp. W02-3]QCY69288.1 type III pantothenate kinase [Antarcticibacterium flavum]
MNLVIDIGNTLVKMAVFQDATLLKKKTSLRQDFFKNLEEIFQNYPNITHSLLSVVGKTPAKLEEKLREKTILITMDRELPQVFKNKYATPNTLGQDRIALVSAASKLYAQQNVLIIDAGTCITYDILNSQNEYYGGAISPGLHMRYKAMHTFTEKLPLLEPEEEVSLTGNSTRGSMHSGVIFGITAEIDGIIDAYRAQYKELTVILTGGDAQFLCKRLKNSIFANSNFLLEGLNNILEFNKPQ